MSKQKNLIDPEKDVVKAIFPLTTRFGQTCTVCGQFHFLDEITIDYDLGWICFGCLEGMEKVNKEDERFEFEKDKANANRKVR